MNSNFGHGFDSRQVHFSVVAGCIAMLAEMLCTKRKRQRDDTTMELAKSKTYGVGNYESVTLKHYSWQSTGIKIRRISMKKLKKEDCIMNRKEKVIWSQPFVALVIMTVAAVLAVLVFIVVATVEAEEGNSAEQEYILSYGVDKVNYVGFVAERVEYQWDKNKVTYYLDDSYIFVDDGYIVRRYDNGTIECYTNGMITAH